MKALFVIVLAAGILAGCNSAPKAGDASPTPAVTKDQKLAVTGKLDAPSSIDIPSWYIKAPASTDEYIFITGTGISTDLSMSRTKAMLDAQYQLADKINGMVDAVVRQSRQDSGATMNGDSTSSYIRKTISQTPISGHHLEDTRIMAENKAYRTFVLVRYPLGDANKLLKQFSKSTTNVDKDVDAALKPQ